MNAYAMRSRVSLLAFVAVLSTGSVASARPEGPSVFCATYPESAACLGRTPGCELCHDSTFPASWNGYGLAIIGALPRQASFADELPAALALIESADSDMDGVSNVQELMDGTAPGDATSVYEAMPQLSDVPNPFYDIGNYDVAFAYRRASALYCGRSPTYEEMAPFRDANTSDADKRALMHERVSSCLDADYWRLEGLQRLADDRIRPIKNISSDTDLLIGVLDWQLKSSMGDYNYDYRMWTHILTEDRDARDLLLAQYYIAEDPDGTWRVETNMIQNPDAQSTAGGQLLEQPYRAGMMTTMWFLARNTMFSDMPRTTAAMVYRAYLGLDISRTEGLIPVPGEPDDIDNKGVQEPRCAGCHSTLDPLAYAFAKYEGLDYELDFFRLFGLVAGLSPNFAFGSFDATRPSRLMPGWSDAEQQPYIFGQPVDDLREFAQVAVESDAFARNLANIFYVHALSREATTTELGEFGMLWQSLPEDDFSANRLIHRLIDTDAFGVP